MQLLPESLRNTFASFPIRSQVPAHDAKVIVKYFFPAGRYTFYVTEGEPVEGDFLFYGYCVSALGADCDEWGYVTLSELESVRILGLRMERDLHFPIATHTVGEALGRTRRAISV